MGEALELLETGEPQRASRRLFELSQNFATQDSGDTRSWVAAAKGFEKAALDLQRSLEELPRSLTYREVLFEGLGRDCEAARHGSGTVWEDFHRCCDEPFPISSSCMLIFEMMMNAVGRGQRKTEEGEDTYFGEMSEQWAFRHFNPSMMFDNEHSKNVAKFAEAFDFDADIAQALADEGEPTLGIVWADLAASFQSAKFLQSVFYLTLLLHSVRADSGPRPIDVFEIGAGYGTLPRLLAGSRQRLLAMGRALDIQSYAALDVRSVNDLQRWYLQKSLNDRVEVRGWPLPESAGTKAGQWRTTAGPWKSTTGVAPLWGSRHAGSPLLVDLVDRTHRDLFVHLYSEAHNSESSGASGDALQPVRLLVAVNSWHEMPQTEWLWYYNEFVAGPSWRVAADWILYVSNQEWDASDDKEAMLLQPSFAHRFETHWQRCEDVTCIRLFKRRPANA